jgi:hypothetical protein
MTQASNLAKGGSNFNSTGNLSLTTGVTGTLPVANGGTGATSSTGSGAVVLATSPTVTTPTIDKINTSVANISLGAGNASAMKNRIINGAMVIDQRNAGASVTIASGGTYTLDRYQAWASGASKYSVQQNAGSVTPPVGFKNYLGVTSLAATSLGASDYYYIAQKIEGYNVADLGFGTANAKTITISFWVYSSLTGTFGCSISNAAENRFYPFTYTISAANTWQQISTTIAGDTSGTWGSTTGTGIQVIFGLGIGTTYSATAGAWGSGSYGATGATSVVGTNGATFYITGVQLEVGSSATGFEYRQYGTELSNCYRYFQMFKNGTINGAPFSSFTQAINSTDSYGILSFMQTMRSAPTLAYGGNLRLVDQSSGIAITSLTGNAGYASTYTIEMRAQTSSSLTTNRIYNINNNADATAYVSLSAEL